MMHGHFSTQRKGLSLLLLVITLGALGTIMIAGLASRNIDALQVQSFGLRDARVQSVLEGCMDNALVQFARDTDFTGATVTQDSISCVNTVSKSGSQWTIDATATGLFTVKKARAVVRVQSKTLIIVSWTFLPA